MHKILFLPLFFVLSSCTIYLDHSTPISENQNLETVAPVILNASQTPIPTRIFKLTPTENQSTATNPDANLSLPGIAWVLEEGEPLKPQQGDIFIWGIDFPHQTFLPISDCIPILSCPNSSKIFCVKDTDWFLYDLQTLYIHKLDKNIENYLDLAHNDFYMDSLSCSQDGKYLVIPYFSDAQLLSLDLQTLELATAFHNAKINYAPKNGFSYSPSLEYYVGTEDFSYTLINWKNEVIYIDPPGLDVPTGDVYFSPINQQVIYGFDTNSSTTIGGDIFLWESDKFYIVDKMSSSQLLAMAPEGYQYFTTYLPRNYNEPWSPDGNFIAFIAYPDDVSLPLILCNIKSLDKTQECFPFPKTIGRWYVSNASWSPDSKYIAVAFNRNEAGVYIFDVIKKQWITLVFNKPKSPSFKIQQLKLIWR